MKMKRKNEKKRKGKEMKHKQNLHKVMFYDDYVMALSKVNALQLNSKKRIK